MNQSDMILEFIDGTLDSGSEQTLFDDMAHHPELRAELRQYVMIGDAVRADREAYTPPADVERRLLGGLGLFPLAEAGGAAAAGAAVATGGTAAGATSAVGWLALSNLKSMLLPLLVGVLLGGAVAGGGVYLAMNDSSEAAPRIASSDALDAAGTGSPVVPDGPAATPSASTSSTASAGAGAASSSTAGAGSVREGSFRGNGSGKAASSATRRSERQFAKDGLQTDNVNSGNDQQIDEGVGNTSAGNRNATDKLTPMGGGGSPQAAEPNPAFVEILDQLELETEAPKHLRLIDRDVFTPETPDAHQSPSVLTAPPATSTSASERGSFIAVELRKGFLTQPFADNNARRVEKDFLSEDLIAGAYYSRDAAWFFGLEGGRERFTQSLFYNQAETLLVEQRPAIAWGGVAFGRRMEAFDIPFFLQGTLGASQYGGPMARGRIGFDVAELLGRGASSAFSLPISFEASSLVYTYNGQYLVTGNWGLSGGVRMRFGF